MNRGEPKQLERGPISESNLPAVILESPGLIEPSRKPRRIERLHHREAFAFYYALGQDRNLRKVAEEFKQKESTVLNWSATFEWQKKIQELEARSQEQIFKEKAISLLNLVLDSLTKRDEKGEVVLTSTEKVTVEKLKMAIDSFKRLRDDSREGEPGSGEGSGGDGLHKGPKTAVQVNVTIIKESANHFG